MKVTCLLKSHNAFCNHHINFIVEGGCGNHNSFDISYFIYIIIIIILLNDLKHCFTILSTNNVFIIYHGRFKYLK